MWNDHELSKMVQDGIPFPMASDQAGNLGRAYGVFDEGQGIELRGRFIIDPDGVIQAMEVLTISPPGSALFAGYPPKPVTIFHNGGAFDLRISNRSVLANPAGEQNARWLSTPFYLAGDFLDSAPTCGCIASQEFRSVWSVQESSPCHAHPTRSVQSQ